MKINYRRLVIIALLISLLTTIVINGIMLTKAPNWFPASQNNDWIGFYGNLVGSLIGAAATIYVFIRTIQHAERKDSTDKRLNVLP